MQLSRQPVCFVGFACLPIRQCRFIQCSRSDGRIIVKQSDSLESFARVIEISALQLHFTREQARFRIYASLRLQRHDLFGDFLSLVWFMGADLDRAEREQHLRLSRRVFRCLQIFTESVLGFGQILQLGRCVSEIKQEIGLNAARIIDLAKRAQVFFRGLRNFSRYNIQFRAIPELPAAHLYSGY